METLENPLKNGEIKVRNEKGQIIKGAVLNPNGKPLGAKHMTTLLMTAIKKVATDTGTRADIEIVKKLIEKAKEGDTKAIEMIFDRSDGKPVQQVDARVMQIDPLTIEQQQKLNQLLNA